MNDPTNGNPSPLPGETRAASGAVRRRFARTALLGFAIFLFAWHWVSGGIAWSVGYHPDEIPVAHWIDSVRRDGYIVDRPYPGGWFELARPAAWAGVRAGVLSASRSRRRAQEGSANAMDPATFVREPVLPRRVRHDIQWGRDFNAFLYACTALLIFLAAGEAGLGAAGAAVSAAFFLALPAPLEHAHYCETDAGVLFSLALFFWAAVAAARRNSPVSALAAGFAAGFCVSCKYTVAPLVLVPPALGALLGARGRRPGRAAAWAALSLCAALAGFVAGTPVLYLDPRMVLDALFDGGKPATWQGSAFVKFASLVRETRKAGVPALLWAAFSVPFWACRPWRRALAGPALFGALYLVGVFALLPWFRNQETLPLLAVLSLGAGLPVAAAVRLPPEARRRRAPVLVAGAAILAAVLAAGFFSSSRTLSAFRRRESRAEFRGFLDRSFPRWGRALAESYVRRGLDGVPGEIYVMNHVPEDYPGSLAKPEVEEAAPRYLFRDPTLEKRAGDRRDPFTGRHVPAVLAAIESFRRDATLLRAWSLPDGWPHPVFAQHDAELWLLPQPPDAPGRGLAGVPVPFARPAAVLPTGVSLREACGTGWLGPDLAMRAGGHRAEVLVPRDGAPRWAVVRHVSPDGTPVSLSWKGSFRPASSAPLAPGSAAAAAAPAATPAFAADPFRASRVRIRGDRKANACIVSVTADPAEAAFALLRAGKPAEGLALLRAAPCGPGTGAGRVAAFLCAAAAGEEPDPAWRKEAESALAAFDALRAAVSGGPFPGAAEVCGVPLEALRDFSRLRLPRTTVLSGVTLGAFLPAGEYRLEVSFPPGRAEQVAGRVFFEGQEEPFSLLDGPEDSPRAAAPLRFASDGLLRFLPDLPLPVPDDPLFFRGIEISWDPLRPVAETAEKLRAALGN